MPRRLASASSRAFSALVMWTLTCSLYLSEGRFGGLPILLRFLFVLMPSFYLQVPKSQAERSRIFRALCSASRAALSAVASICATTRPAIQTERPAREMGGGSSNRDTIRRTVLGVTPRMLASRTSSRIAFSGRSARASIRIPLPDPFSCCSLPFSAIHQHAFAFRNLHLLTHAMKRAFATPQGSERSSGL